MFSVHIMKQAEEEKKSARNSRAPNTPKRYIVSFRPFHSVDPPNRYGERSSFARIFIVSAVILHSAFMIILLFFFRPCVFGIRLFCFETQRNVYSWTNGCSHIQTVKPSIVKRSPSTRANASVYVCVVCRWSDECISGPERDRYTAHKSAGSHNSLSSCCFHFHASHEFGRMVCVCDGSPSLLPAQPTDVHDVLTQVLRIHWLREFSSVSITRNNSPVPMSQRAPMGRPVIDIYIQS